MRASFHEASSCDEGCAALADIGLELTGEAAQVRRVPNAIKGCVPRRATTYAATRPELQLRDRGVRYVKLVLPRTGLGDSEGPSHDRVYGPGVGEHKDSLSKVPVGDFVAEGHDQGRELDQGLAPFDAPVLRPPDGQVRPLLKGLERLRPDVEFG